MAVILCECDTKISSRLDLEALKTRIEEKGEKVFIRNMPCREGINDILAYIRTAEPVVIGGCWEETHKHAFMDTMKKGGFDPFAFSVSNLLGEKFGDRAELLLTAGAERVRLSSRTHEGNLKPSFGRIEGRLSRRQFLRIPRIHYELVPAIDNARCRSNARHCRICFPSCPNNALAVDQAERVYIEKDQCSGCGACVSACPVMAVTYPGYTAHEVMREIDVLLSDANPMKQRAVLFVCEKGSQILHEFFVTGRSLPEGVFPVLVPCLAFLNSFYFMYSFAKGAAGIGLLSCQENGSCSKGITLKKVQNEMFLTGVLLCSLDAFGQRISFISTGSLSDIQKGLQSFSERLDTLEPIETKNKRGFSLENNEYSLTALLAKMTDKSVRVEGHISIPSGVVSIYDALSCTFCGVCEKHCPAGALVVDDSNGTRELRFSYRGCIGCGECVRRCPETILRIRRIINTERLRNQTSTVLAKESAILCSECGIPFLNESLFRKIRSGFTTPEADKVIRMCPDCRAKTAFSALFKNG